MLNIMASAHTISSGMATGVSFVASTGAFQAGLHSITKLNVLSKEQMRQKFVHMLMLT